MKPVYIIDLNISDYHLMVFNDLMRMFVMQMVVQVLFFLRHDGIELFSSLFIENTLFILLGLIVYWYVFNNIFVVTNKKEDSNSLKERTIDDFYQSNYNQSNYNHLKILN